MTRSVKKGDWFKAPTLLAPFLFIAVAISLLCVYLVNQGSSPLVTVTQRVADLFEGFQTVPTASPKCPDGYTFFTNATGESLCCSGQINPFSHTCTPNATTDNYGGMCAFSPGVADPRQTGKTLPLCANVQDAISTSTAKNLCPPSLPIYAASLTQQSCCQTATNLDGTDCMADDLRRNTFCRVNPKKGEPNCETMRALETAICPKSLAKTTYTMGDKEVTKYSKAKGMIVPLCFGVEGSCFPDDTVRDMKFKGVFTSEPAPEKWKFGCTGYSSYVGGATDGISTSYLN